MKIITDNLDFLKKVAKTKSVKKRNRYLVNAKADEILAILESCINILKFRVKLTKPQHKRLKVHTDYLRNLGRKRSEKSTREFLQTGAGAFLPALLLPILAQVAINLLRNGKQIDNNS